MINEYQREVYHDFLVQANVDLHESLEFMRVYCVEKKETKIVFRNKIFH